MSAGDKKSPTNCKLDFKPEEAIFITQYESPTRFRYITLEDLRANGRIVNHLESQLEGQFQAGKAGKVYQESQYVIVCYLQWKSEKYLRGQVISLKGSDYMVQSLDYGFLIQCRGQDLMPLPKKFRNIYIEIKNGGLSGVSSVSGKDWSQRESAILSQKLEEAQLLVFRVKCHKYGQLWIKSHREQETWLNAAQYLVENQRALHDPKWSSDAVEPTAVELNKLDAKPNKTFSNVLRLVETEHTQVHSDIVDSDRMKEQHQFRLIEAYRKLNAIKPSPTIPSEQPERLNAILGEHRMPSIPDSARLLSVVTNRHECSVERALLSDSSSFSSNGSSCSSDTSDTRGVSKELAYQSRDHLPKPSTAFKTNRLIKPHQRKFSNIDEDSQLVTPRSNTKQEKFLSKNKSNELVNPVKELEKLLSQLKLEPVQQPQSGEATLDQRKNTLEERNTENVDHINRELRGTATQFGIQKTLEIKDTPKVADSNKSTKQLKVKEGEVLEAPGKTVPKMSSSGDKKKLDHIYNQYVELLKNGEDKSKSGVVPKAKEVQREKLLLVHSKAHVMPVNGSPETLFCEKLWMSMVEMNHQHPWHMQRYAWPHLLRGDALVLINGTGTGRSWCYLPMLCCQVEGWLRVPFTRQQGATNLGPLAIILADSVGHARLLYDYCCKLMGSYDPQMLKVINTHNHSLEDVQIMLLNSCGILITTVSHMKLLFVDSKLELINPLRLKCFIVDDYDRMLPSVNESLQLLQRPELGQLQLIIIAQRWHGRVFIPLLKRFNRNPLLLFGDFLVAAIYGNMKMDVVLRHSSKKTHQLMEFLSERCLGRRTAIFCRTKEQLADLQEELTIAGHECLGLSNAVHQQSHELLLVSDEDQQETLLPIRHFEVLVHYSFPATWSKFCHRFHAIMDNIANCLVPQQTPKEILSYVMLDEHSSYELPRLAQFLRSHDIKMDKQIDQIVASCRQAADQNRALCSLMLSRGKCTQSSTCQKRHYLMDGDFQGPRCPLWQAKTELRCKLIKAFSPVHFSVMVESYKSSDCGSWKATHVLSKLRKLSSSINVHMSQEENRRVQQELNISDVCVIHQGISYQRVRIVDLSDQRLITVQLLDESTELLRVKPNELFECPTRFKKSPPLAMDVRLYGLIPCSIEEEVWQPEAICWLNEKLKGLGDKQHLQLSVEFGMLNTVYVREITVVQECPTMKTSVRVLQIRNELIRRRFAQQEEQSIMHLCVLHQEIFRRMQEKGFLKDELKDSGAETALGEQEMMEQQQFDTLKNDLLEKKENRSKQRQDFNKVGIELKDELCAGKEATMDLWVNQSPQRKSPTNNKKTSRSSNPSEKQTENTLREAIDKDSLKIGVTEGKVSSDENLQSTNLFIDTLLRDLQSNEPLIQGGAKRIVQEMLNDDDSVTKTTPVRKNPTTTQKATPSSMPQALCCASTAGNAVRPKVIWHQTLRQIELIFEQQVAQYELMLQGNVVVYQVLETTPPQRCVLNLLSEVRIMSEQQHGYQLHVKLAKQTLIQYWPTLLSSLGAQQNCRWLVYDTARSKCSNSEIGRIMWMRYLRGVCSSKCADDDESKWSSEDEVSSSDEN